MPYSEIVITLFTIIYGLMLADLFFSLHKLLRSRKLVQWHWVPLLAGWYLLLVILKNWWDLTSLFNETQSIGILQFIAYGHMLALLFLLASAALPDRIPAGGIDLQSFYLGNSRYFWGLMTAVIAFSMVMNLVRDLSGGIPVGPLQATLSSVFLVLNVILAISRRLWLHAILLCLFVIMLFLEIAARTAI